MTQNTSFAGMALTTADWFRYNELDSSLKKAGNIVAAKSAALGTLAIAAIEAAVSTVLQVAGLLVYPITSRAYTTMTKHTQDSLSTISAAFQKVMQSQKRVVIAPIVTPLQNRWAKLKRGVWEIGTQLKIKSHIALGVCEKHKGKILGAALVTTLIGLSFFLQEQRPGLDVPPKIEPLNVTKSLFNNTCEDSPLNASSATKPLLNKTFEVSTAATSQPAEEPKEVIASLKPTPPFSNQEKPELPIEVTELYKRPVSEVWGELADKARRLG